MCKKYRDMAYMGIVGAVLFAVGDWLIYLYPGLTLENDIQALWAEMPAVRFVGPPDIPWHQLPVRAAPVSPAPAYLLSAYLQIWQFERASQLPPL